MSDNHIFNVPPSIIVTYGYAIQQCVRESVLGALVALSAIVGIIGSIVFPFLRKRFNVTRYGTQPFSIFVIY